SQATQDACRSWGHSGGGGGGGGGAGQRAATGYPEAKAMEAGSCRYQFRIALLGDAAVGKTSLLRGYVAGARGTAELRAGLEPELESGPTVGMEVYSRPLQLRAGPRVKLQLWDTAGQERFRCVTRSFYRNVVGVLLVFDVTNRKSFEHIRDWYREVMASQGPDKVIFLLVGHKSDLQSTRCVSVQEAEELAASLGMAFLETSAQNQHNVDLAFDTLAEAIRQALQQGDIKLEEDWGGVRLIQIPRPPPRKQKPGLCHCWGLWDATSVGSTPQTSPPQGQPSAKADLMPEGIGVGLGLRPAWRKEAHRRLWGCCPPSFKLPTGTAHNGSRTRSSAWGSPPSVLRGPALQGGSKQHSDMSSQRCHGGFAKPSVLWPPVPMDTLWHYQFRIILLGDATVGKSSLLRRYTEDIFVEGVNQTVGVDFSVHFMEVEPGVQVKLQFWDTAGQERFWSVTRSYYRNSAGGLLLFDITNRTSFENITRWHQEALEKVKPFNILFLVVGHKSDLEAERQVRPEEGEKLAASLGARYVETSAKSNSNIGTAFGLLTQEIYEAVKRGVMEPHSEWEGVKSRVHLRPNFKKQRSKAGQGGCACAGDPWVNSHIP
ncbi:Ras-related protein Rab-42, partial [Galemys pyrenaicus]